MLNYFNKYTYTNPKIIILELSQKSILEKKVRLEWTSNFIRANFPAD